MGSQSSMRFTKTLFIVACCTALCAFEAKAAPVVSETGVIRFLEQFGYLPPGRPQSASIMTKESLSKAISAFQSFMGINVTGNVDDETNRLMKAPRCGLSDKAAVSSSNGRSKRYAILGNRWRSQIITYRVSKYSNKLNPRDVDQVIVKAFGVWAGYVNLDFRPASYGQADIDIRFERGYHAGDYQPFDGPGQNLAHAFPPGPGIQGDVHFDEDENWTIGNGYGDSIDFFQIAVHEIGHALGLDHSNVRTAIMWPTYRSNIDVRLDRDDIAGIQALYGPKNRVEDPVVSTDPWINTIYPVEWQQHPFFSFIQPAYA